jgi:SPOR domain
MAESNHRSYCDPTAIREAPMPRPHHSDDPLAGLARLISQSVPVNHLGYDSEGPKPAGTRSARKFNPPAQYGYAAPDVAVQEKTEATLEQGNYEIDSPNITADLRVEPSSAGYSEYEDQSLDHSEDHVYGEDSDEDPNPRRRGGFIFVAAVLGLALLGTAGAFACRTLFADWAVPPALSIIKAESGPNVPTATASQASVSSQSESDNVGSSGEERLMDVPPPVSTAPRQVSKAPIIPDPASVLPPTPLAQPAPATGVDMFNTAPAAPASPIVSANKAGAPDAPTPTPTSPTKPGPKKIRTVSIRTDQPNAVDSATSQPQSAPRWTKPSDANPPLSIVPSSNDAAKPAAGSARTVPLMRPARAKQAKTEIASRAPAESGGGYAVQVLSQRNEEGVQSSFRALQAKYPKLLGGREPMVRRADLGAKGVYYRAMVGPFASTEQANHLCSNLKAAGGSCIVEKN